MMKTVTAIPIEYRSSRKRHSQSYSLTLCGTARVVFGAVLCAALTAFVIVPTAMGEMASSTPATATTHAARAANLRLVSLNPSLSAIVLRLGAGDSLVGVDDYSAKLLREISDRPRVGGLFDPGLEAILALRPDRVLLVAGVEQQVHAERLAKLGIEVEIYQNERLEQVLENIERLGVLLDRGEIAALRIREILDMRAAVRSAVEGRSRTATLAIVDRSPLFIVGGDTFLDEMLAVVGAKNLGRELAAGYPRASIEWLIAVGPELVLDMTPGALGAAAFWARWPSLPAVAADRVLDLDASRISMPGPDLDQALRELAIAVQGPEIAGVIDQQLAEIATRRRHQTEHEAKRP